MNKIKRKRLFFDIETSPNIGFFWQAGYKLNVPYDNIIKERAIICICYKWEGDKKVYSLTWDEHQNDKSMLEKFVEIANESHEMIGHNGDKFDLPWIRTRCLFHKIPMFPKYTTIDTLYHARTKFRFNSNRLDYIARFLGLGEKTETGGFGLWKDIVLNNDSDLLRDMVEYCKNDVIILEKIYSRLSDHFPNKAHHGAIHTGEKSCCPECSSTNLKLATTRYTSTGIPRIQVQCRDCFKYNTISSKTYQDILEKQVIKEE
jgi:hypothetical protein